MDCFFALEQIMCNWCEFEKLTLWAPR